MVVFERPYALCTFSSTVLLSFFYRYPELLPLWQSYLHWLLNRSEPVPSHTTTPQVLVYCVKAAERCYVPLLTLKTATCVSIVFHSAPSILSLFVCSNRLVVFRRLSATLQSAWLWCRVYKVAAVDCSVVYCLQSSAVRTAEPPAGRGEKVGVSRRRSVFCIISQKQASPFDGLQCGTVAADNVLRTLTQSPVDRLVSLRVRRFQELARVWAIDRLLLLDCVSEIQPTGLTSIFGPLCINQHVGSPTQSTGEILRQILCCFIACLCRSHCFYMR